MTSGSHGKPYPNWALLGAAGEMNGIANWRHFDGFVTRGIDIWLTDTLGVDMYPLIYPMVIFLPRGISIIFHPQAFHMVSLPRIIAVNELDIPYSQVQT